MACLLGSHGTCDQDVSGSTVWMTGTETVSRWWHYGPTKIGSLRWRHNGCDSVSNHQPHDCFLNRLFRRRSKKTSKLRVTGLCAGNSPGTGEFPAQMASYAKNVSKNVSKVLFFFVTHAYVFSPSRPILYLVYLSIYLSIVYTISPSYPMIKNAIFHQWNL